MSEPAAAHDTAEGHDELAVDLRHEDADVDPEESDPRAESPDPAPGGGS